MKDYLNSIMLYNFQKFYINDFMYFHNNPFIFLLTPTLPVPSCLSPLVTTSSFSESMSLFLVLFTGFCFVLFCFCHLACEILVSRPGIEPVPAAVKKAQNLNHWITREFSDWFVVFFFFLVK